MKGKNHNLSDFTPKKAVEEKISLIPVDRGGCGGVLDLTLEENLNMQVLKKFNPFFLNKKKMMKNATELIEQYEVHPDNPTLNFSQLSGGNQQKVLLAKWVQETPNLLILHEPSQGVDVGARQQIYKHIDAAAKKGTAVICSSSDYEELEQICNKIIVLVKGQIIAVLTGDEITKENITKMCFASFDDEVA